MNDDLQRIWKEAVVFEWRYAAGSNREFRAMLTGVLVEFRATNLPATSLSRTATLTFSVLTVRVNGAEFEWSLHQTRLILSAVRAFMSSLYCIICEGLTVWVGLIMFGKLGTRSKEGISEVFLCK